MSGESSDQSAKGSGLREVRDAPFGTAGRAAVTFGVLLVLTVFGYLVLLPSGIFDDREFRPTPWEEWGLPGEPPSPRPPLSAWFEHSASWQEVESLWEEPGVQDAFWDLRDQLLADPDDMPAGQEEEAEMALRYAAALGEVAEELIPVLRDYSLLLPDSASLVGGTEGTGELVRFARGLGLLVRASHSDLATGWSACESLVLLGRFAAEALPLGEASVTCHLVTMAIASELAHIALEALSQPGREWSDEVIQELRALLALLRQRSGESLPRTAYEQVQSAERVFDEFAGPGAAWRGSSAVFLNLGIILYNPSFERPEWLDRPVHWWLVARVQRNRTLAQVEEAHRHAAAWLQLPPWERSGSDEMSKEDGWEDNEQLPPSLFLDPRPNAIGEEMPRLIAGPIWDLTSNLQVTIEASAAMVDIVLAIKQWQRAGGHAGLPLALGALVPDFLDEIPIDPFSGRPFGYDAERRFLWSVGADGVDSGGKKPEDFSNLRFELREDQSGTLDLGRIFEAE